ncbi:hypothetical protein CTAM01_16295 [Colletotrichum tamarilloi]|uniref:Uncharacterized protein n=1 Tax=Colletotrichum tamarilloi TaxID=1209934 RepID=A0ABQ9QIX8_9PEZI|nr:uncharacterized protein CTAM01_16295 [Colletotrichum tamarilloi]KAK1472743.1 hypothetical protein CTAM01_16295 [Colletotrichum tamarilloi]
MVPRYSAYASLFPIFLQTCLAQDTSIISVPYESTYLLPSPFHGNLFHSFVNGTNTLDALTNELLQSATKSPFISYGDEPLALLGQNPAIELIEKRPGNFAGEAGVWISDRNELWYTTWINDGPTHVEILDLNNNSIRNLTSSQSLKNPNGGFYHQGLMYFTCLRDDSRDWSGGVVSVNPETGHVETALDSYFGLKFDNIDDVA